MIGHFDRRLLNRGMTLEIRPEQLTVPGPAVFGVGGRVHADKSAAGSNIVFKRGLLGSVQHVARRVQEHDGFERRQIRCGECGGIFGVNDREVVRGAERLNGRHTLVDRRVPKAGRLRKHEHVERGHHPPRLQHLEREPPAVAFGGAPLVPMKRLNKRCRFVSAATCVRRPLVPRSPGFSMTHSVRMCKVPDN